MINAAIEGESDRGVADAIIRAAGHDVGRIIAQGGKSKLDPLIPKYSVAAKFDPWVVFRDSDTECPVKLHQRLTSGITAPATFLLRIAHTMSEAWLLADRDGFANYFGVRIAAIRLFTDEGVEVVGAS
ncbi:MAG: hypothetical protein EKK51_04135, partial [Mycolicibacterium sp.]|uniref:hypothetical protein n=1 Tax=Mycolicibacterium sp. TaxID=2320850 RepID=UPI000F949BF8